MPVYGFRNILLLGCLIVGCGKIDESTHRTSQQPEAHADAHHVANLDDTHISEETSSTTNPYLIRRGTLVFPTNDRVQSRHRITSAIQQHRGFLADEHQQRNHTSLSETLTIRIEASRFDDLVAAISQGIEQFDVREIDATDVSQEFIDLEARLTTRKDTEQRYRDLLKQANSIDEILKIEAHLDTIRGEIESSESRFRFLQNQIQFSSLTVTFYEPIVTSQHFMRRFSASLTRGWFAATEFIIALASIWPVLMLIGLVAWLLQTYLRKERTRYDNRRQPQQAG